MIEVLVHSSSSQPMAQHDFGPWMLNRVQHDGIVDERTSSSRHPELVSGSILPRAPSNRGQAEADCKVVPIGIVALDQIDLPRTAPSFELFFARDGLIHGGKHLKANEGVDVVAAGEAFDRACPVLMQPADKVGRNADIQRPMRLARENVSGGVAFKLHNAECEGEWTLKQVQGDGNYD